MNFDQANQFLLSLVNLPRQEYMSDSRYCNFYLERLQKLLDILRNPEKKISHYIHVTGTSGKGSVCNFINEILLADGNTVGSTFSPHPTRITERWKINGQEISNNDFINSVEAIKKALDIFINQNNKEVPSYFEVLEAMSLKLFADKKVNWVVLEAGCGGRYDSSNIIPKKNIAVITNVGLDHVGVIGNNIEEIAYEKAGIIKPNCDVFTAEKNKKILDIIETECKKTKTNLNKTFTSKYAILNSSLDGTKFDYNHDIYELQTIGEHQVSNAILAIEIANHLKINKTAIKKGLKKTIQPMRMQVISKKPIIILDGAHNPDKIKTTTEAVKKIKYKNLHLVIGFSGDKDTNKMLKQILELKPKSIAITRNTSNQFRKVSDPKKLAAKIKKASSKTETQIFLDPKDAYKWSKHKTKNNDLLLVTGSLFLSGEIKNIA